MNAKYETLFKRAHKEYNVMKYNLSPTEIYIYCFNKRNGTAMV